MNCTLKTDPGPARGELSLSYRLGLPTKRENTLSSIELTATGRNLVLWTEFEGNDRTPTSRASA